MFQIWPQHLVVVVVLVAVVIAVVIRENLKKVAYLNPKSNVRSGS